MLDLKNKKISVLGLGISGASAAKFLAKLGAELVVSDLKKDERFEKELSSLARKASFFWGEHPREVVDCDIIIKSPGISMNIELMREASKKNVLIWTDIELASYFLESKNISAITGTNGKSTVTALTAHLLKESYKNVVMAGNIGIPVCDVIPLADERSKVVLEVSSYQLECVNNFRAKAGVLTNITPDHLTHHGSMDNYIESKLKLFKNQDSSDYAILNYDDPEVRNISRSIKSNKIFFSLREEVDNGVFWKKGEFICSIKNLGFRIKPALKIIGEHNIANALCAGACAAVMGVSGQKLSRGLESFEGLEHRLENSGNVGGVKFINDSKATNVESTIIGLKAVDSKNIRLILGGEDKGFPYKPLEELIKTKVKKIYLIGEASAKIKKELASGAEMADSGDMKTAVLNAFKESKPGDVVLLSPACASFDQFDNFEHRGRYFKEVVRSLQDGKML